VADAGYLFYPADAFIDDIAQAASASGGGDEASGTPVGKETAPLLVPLSRIPIAEFGPEFEPPLTKDVYDATYGPPSKGTTQQAIRTLTSDATWDITRDRIDEAVTLRLDEPCAAAESDTVGLPRFTDVFPGPLCAPPFPEEHDAVMLLMDLGRPGSNLFSVLFYTFFLNRFRFLDRFFWIFSLLRRPGVCFSLWFSNGRCVRVTRLRATKVAVILLQSSGTKNKPIEMKK
jgi:hypothetical protein